MTAKSVNNPYGYDQVPEWELWERAAHCRGEALGYEGEAEARTKAARIRHEEAAKIEAALSKLRPPNGVQT
jgi:hypothetical protein